MADVKISQLPVATTPLDGTELAPIVQSGTTKRVSVANLTVGRALTASSLTLTTPLSAANGGTGLTSLGTGVATALGVNTGSVGAFVVNGGASFISPLHIGGTTASSTLTLQSTSGVGTSDSIMFKVGNNGATIAATFDTNGNLGIGTTSPLSRLTLSYPTVTSTSTIRELLSFSPVDQTTNTFGALNGITFRFNNSTYTAGSLDKASGVYGINTDDQNSGLFGRSAGLVFYTSAIDSAATEKVRIDSSGNFVVNTAALATTATDGFIYVPTCAGIPTGTPTTYTGRSPIIVDTSSGSGVGRLYIRVGSTWRYVALT